MSKRIVSSHDEYLISLLKALGMPDDCYEFTVTARVNDIVRAEAKFHPDVEDGEPITKRYTLVEQESVQSIKDRCPG